MWTKDEVMSEDISTIYTLKIISSESTNAGIQFVAYGNDKFAASNNSAIYTSETGTFWTRMSVSGITNVYIIVYYAGLFLFGTNSGIYYISSSGTI